MPKIIIAGNYSKIVDEPDIEYLAKLDKHLSFYVLGAEHTPSYKGYYSNGKWVRWDGWKKLMTNKLSFATGLVERVKQFYADNERSIDIEDWRGEKSPNNPIDITANLKKLGIEPRDYQVETANLVDKYDRGIIKLPTGSGKSVLSAMIVAKIGKKSIVYVIGKDLLYQFHKLFSSVFDEEIGIVGDGLCSIKNHNIVSVWTAAQALGMKKKDILLDDDDGEKAVGKDKYSDILELIKTAKLIQLDECHIAAAETIQKIYRASNQEHIYGLSGSPWRTDGQSLLIEAALGKYIANISASSLIEKGWLAKPIIKFIEVPFEKVPKNYAQAYKEYIVENPIRNALVVKYTKMLVSKGYKTLVLFSSLKHGKILYDLMSSEVNCEMIDGSDDQDRRDSVKEKITSGKIDCILASRIYDIGIDVPCLSGLVMASAGKSSVKILQRTGRVLRKYPGKDNAAIVDFADNAIYLKQHAKARYDVYSSEEGFDVSWPEKVK
jgi:superfamily II DNA or RNA helicase